MIDKVIISAIVFVSIFMLFCFIFDTGVPRPRRKSAIVRTIALSAISTLWPFVITVLAAFSSPPFPGLLGLICFVGILYISPIIGFACMVPCLRWFMHLIIATSRGIEPLKAFIKQSIPAPRWLWLPAIAGWCVGIIFLIINVDFGITQSFWKPLLFFFLFVYSPTATFFWLLSTAVRLARRTMDRLRRLRSAVNW